MAQKKNFKTPAMQFISAVEEEQRAPETMPEDLQPGKDRIGYTMGWISEKKTERMQLLVKPSIKAAIKKAAEDKGLSMNDLISQIFEEYLERQA